MSTPPLTAGLIAAIPLADAAFAAWLQGYTVDRARYQQLLRAATGNAALSQHEHHQILWHDLADACIAVLGVASGGLAYYAIPRDGAPPGIAAARQHRDRLTGTLDRVLPQLAAREHACLARLGGEELAGRQTTPETVATVCALPTAEAMAVIDRLIATDCLTVDWVLTVTGWACLRAGE